MARNWPYKSRLNCRVFFSPTPHVIRVSSCDKKKIGKKNFRVNFKHLSRFRIFVQVSRQYTSTVLSSAIRGENRNSSIFTFTLQNAVFASPYRTCWFPITFRFFYQYSWRYNVLSYVKLGKKTKTKSPYTSVFAK